MQRSGFWNPASQNYFRLFFPNWISCDLNCKYVLYIFSISSIDIVPFGKLVVWYSHWYLICRSMLTYLRWSVKQKAYINSTHFLDKYNLKRKQKYNEYKTNEKKHFWPWSCCSYVCTRYIKSHSGASAFSAPYVCKLSKKGEERMCFFTKWKWSYWGIIWKQVDALLVMYVVTQTCHHQ